MKKLLSAVIILAAAVVFMSCKKEGEVDLSGRITFVQGEVLLNGTECSFGDTVKEGDTITTGEMSLAVIQFSDISVINLMSNSQLNIETLLSKEGKDSIELEQRRGSSFNKIVKRGTNFSINTPTAVAAVRGTSFSLDVTETGSTLRLSTGYVRVIPVIKGKKVEEDTIEISAGSRVESSAEGVGAPEPVTEKERKYLEALETIAFIEDIDAPETIERIKETPEEQRPLIIPVEVIEVIRDVGSVEKDDQTERSTEERWITLKDIQKKYGALSVIKTTGGLNYTGAFVQEGDLVSVFTTEGTVEIQASDIESVSRYQGAVR